MFTSSILILCLVVAPLLVLAGAALGWRLRSSHDCSGPSRKNERSRATQEGDNSSWLREIVSRLHALTTQITDDVGEHDSRLKKINDEISAASKPDAALIIRSVTHLVEANLCLQKRLSETESKLHEQKGEIEQHSSLSRTDALTGLADGHLFGSEIRSHFEEFQRQGKSFSLAIFDIDHFKQYNETHGRQAGDKALRFVGQLLCQSLGDVHIVARCGGEEFAVILPDTTIGQAAIDADRCREIIAASNVDGADSDRFVTVSVGVAESLPSDSVRSLIRRSVEAVNAAKSHGRNCTSWHDGDSIQFWKEPEHQDVSQPAEENQQLETPDPVMASPDCCEAEREQDERPTAEQISDEQVQAADVGLQSAPAVLHDRTAFCWEVRRRLDQWKQEDAAFSLVLISVGAGDKSAAWWEKNGGKAVAAAMSSCPRVPADQDFVLTRYGPNCYSLLLAQTTLENAIALANELRTEVERRTTRLASSQHQSMLHLGVTAALEDDDWVTLLRRAEQAMEAARREGAAICYNAGRKLETLKHASPPALDLGIVPEHPTVTET